MTEANIPLRGVAFSLVATTMFALVSPYVTLLAPLSGSDIFAWRMIWTLPFTLVLVVLRGRMGTLLDLASDLVADPSKALVLVACACLLAVQQWLFMWAPLHGHMLDVSLGYFLLPIVMVVVGRFVDRQQVHPLQWGAVACAAIGVLNELAFSHAFSWPTLLVALGFPPYFILRRRFSTDSLTLFAAEVLLMQPVALALACTSGNLHVVVQRTDMLVALLPGLGILSTVSFVTYLKASRTLPLALFGLLGYVEPILLVVLSLIVFDEALPLRALWTYVPIALSIVLTSIYVIRVTSSQR